MRDCVVYKNSKKTNTLIYTTSEKYVYREIYLNTEMKIFLLNSHLY